MQLAVVTGAGGFLGRHVARRLSRNGWRVVGFGHGDLSGGEAAAWGMAAWYKGDVAGGSLGRVLAEVGTPALVVHAAGSSTVGAAWQAPLREFERTVGSTAAIIETLRRLAPDAVLVLASSAAVYGDSWSAAIPETAPYAPISPYGTHKQLAEELCLASTRQFGLRCAIIRFFSLYGRELRKQLLWDITRKLAVNPNHLTLSGSGDEIRDILHVEDAARLMALVADAAKRTSPIIVNGGTGRPTTVREVAEALVAALGLRTVVEFNKVSRAGDPTNLLADTARLSEMGFQPVWHFKDGLADFAEWICGEGASAARA